MYLLTKSQALLATTNDIGGKAFNLAKLEKCKVQTPDWFCLSTHYFQTLIDKNDKLKSLIDDYTRLENLDSLKQLIAAIYSEIDKCEIDIIEDVMAHVNGELHYAIRSSAADEDGSHFSFAGQLESFLYVQGKDRIAQAIRNCFKSNFSLTALTYRFKNNIHHTTPKMAVIIQEMIDPQKSGVLFTANPINGHRDEMLISANFGQGEGVVSGECNTDEFTIDDRDVIKSEIREKDFKIIADFENKTTKKIDVEKDEVKSPVLSHDEIRAIRELAFSILKIKKKPQDIEFCIQDGEIYIVQTRDITSLPMDKRHEFMNVFDNSNIQESFNGVTTPLTFSYASKMYFKVYHQLLGLTGLSEKELKKHEKRHKNMIALINGRVFYNIQSWYKGLLLLPSFKQSKGDMEKMMGITDPVDFIEDKDLSFSQRMAMIPNMIKSFGSLLWYFSKIDKVVADFMDGFYEVYNKIDFSKLNRLNLTQLYDLTEELDQKITEKWHAPLINDFYVMMMNGKMYRWMDKLGYENPDLVLGNLLSGESDIASTQPTKELLKISDEIKKWDNTLIDEFLKVENKNVLDFIYLNDKKVYQMCLDYIEAFGDRTIGELKLESLSLREDPSFLINILKNYVVKKSLGYETFIAGEVELRESEEKKVAPVVKKKLSFFARKRFYKDLAKLRKAIRYRENTRLLRTKSFGISRQIYREMGNQMASFELINSPEDIFFLTLSEIEELKDARIVQTRLKDLIELRKAEYESYENDEPGHHFKTFGFVHAGNDFIYEGHTEIDPDGALKGIGCYPGQINGEVALLFKPDEGIDVNDKILCTVRTDPGWAPLFPSIKGLLVEKGSTLSHSAVIARELKIPTIVGIPGITKIIENGDEIEMDCERGIVKIVK
ncbi:phosphoenolpyruvate synthase [Halobacteriovorax vibrionivorans]|uniref:Phosphoenolpyruvate synthase n=1 Tax=Halobacteriovorax vibrionivorans TaxID=2152716 RepID=A0ABY0IEB9_9BACT|nr:MULTISPECIES: PEP/pyruvate-binding domain-containing protein [Halobacteriovorax]RZF21306.1 phosphoenolpyruvate synthase [Halobacteriovorax vibrionivorans]TGD47936.1 phosphoenolpyruvate synthase [Halobacteriovorax sp. Y22]